METFAFVYSRTRTKHHDYRFLANLSNEVCPANVREVFESRVRGMAQTEKGLEHPQWLLVKQKDMVLYGTACMNETLDKAYSLDENPRPLRGFVGIVAINYRGEPLPAGMDTFRAIFRDVMGPIFNSYTQQSHTNKVVDSTEATSFVFPQPFDDKLNVDCHICRVFSSVVDGEALLASCLSCPTDISIAINVASQENVTMPQFNPLANAVICDVLDGEYKDVPVMRVCGICGKETDDWKDGLCSECYGKEHPCCKSCGKENHDLLDGLCRDCRPQVVTPTEYENYMNCERCGCLAANLQHGLCMDCLKELEEQRQKVKNRNIAVCCGVVVLLLLSVAAGIQRCYRERVPVNQILPVLETIPSPESKVLQIIHYSIDSTEVSQGRGTAL